MVGDVVGRSLDQQHCQEEQRPEDQVKVQSGAVAIHANGLQVGPWSIGSLAAAVCQMFPLFVVRFFVRAAAGAGRVSRFFTPAARGGAGEGKAATTAVRPRSQLVGLGFPMLLTTNGSRLALER